jgi:hypothetical protein
MLIDAELREAYAAATLLPDGRSRRGRKTKHDTATRRWIDTVGFPALEMGKRPAASDMAMLKLSPRSSLSGANLTARDAWSQLHGRDPRSKQRTQAEQVGQQTLLAWARINMPSALASTAVCRGRVTTWTLTFGQWKGFSPRQLAMSSAVGLVTPAQLPHRAVPAGAYLLWITGQSARSSKPAFKWEFPLHFYLYLAMRELEAEGRVVKGNDGSLGLLLPTVAHRRYEEYSSIRLTPAEPDADAPANGTSPPPAAAANDDPPAAGALRVPPPPQPVDPIEAATPREQIEFFKGTLVKMSDGDLPPFKEWTRLQVCGRCHPHRPPTTTPLPSPCAPRARATPIPSRADATLAGGPTGRDLHAMRRRCGIQAQAHQVLVLRPVGHRHPVPQRGL